MKVLIALFVAAVVTACGGTPSGQTKPIVVTIPRGATVAATVDSLVARGVVTHPGWFSLYARLRGLGSSLKSGVYEFRADERWSEIVSALALGRGTLVRFTVAEGLQLAEVAEAARAQLGVSRDSFLAAGADPTVLQSLGILGKAATAEGYLYPTTYMVRVHISAGELVRTMVDQFLADWRPEWQPRLDTLGMSRHQLVTLASIIQAEVRYAPDRDYVSAVYHNRLRRGMLLQADPTVVYAYGRRLHRVWEKNLQVRSPYNTYLHPGLPPGPIGQPDTASLHAALYPASTPYIYFVAQPDGKHIFSATYAEHLAAIQQVKRQKIEARQRQMSPR